jgi:DNA-binding winged helix-turn-helix (wHTH) protein
LGGAVQVRIGELLFDDSARQVSAGGTPLHLSPKAFDLLALLVAARPRALSKQEIRDQLWPDVIVDEANLKSLVHEVRTALGDPGLIRTVHRFGYALGAVDRREAPEARLVGTSGVYPLRRGANVIGRDESCEVILDFTGISRQHARITVTAEGWLLEDLGSKNGVWRNDCRVDSPVVLEDGDRIRFGGFPLRFRSTSVPLTTDTIGSV